MVRLNKAETKVVIEALIVFVNKRSYDAKVAKTRQDATLINEQVHEAGLLAARLKIS